MTGASLRNVLGHAKRLRIALRAAEPLCVLRRVPERSPRPAPGFPTFTALRSAGAEDVVVASPCPLRCFALCAKSALLWDGYGSGVDALLHPGCISRAFPQQILPSAYLRLFSLVLHFSLLFQGGVEFPTGGKSGGVKGAPWRRRGACGRADESATRVCVGSHAG